MNPLSFLLPLCLSLSLCLVGACEPSSVDETGYLRPPDIDTTSAEPLDEEESRVLIVVGNPGAVTVPGGLLQVSTSSGNESTLVVDDLDGSFVTVVEATASDTLVLHYEKDGEDQIEIALDGTATLQAPNCDSCLAPVFSAPNVEGNTQVDLSVFDAPSPPYTLFNQDKAIAVRATSVGVFEIAAASGDRVCVYQDAETATSATLCELVP